MRKSVFVAFATLIIGACTYNPPVPTVDVTSAASVGIKQSGYYAALIQTGGWSMTAKPTGMYCWLETYNANLNSAWEEAMKSALTTALEKVDFIGAPIDVPTVVSKGYDAEIVIMQSNASSRMGVNAHFFSSDAISETTLEGVLIITYPDGTREQQPLKGVGSFTQGMWTCNDVAPVVVNAGAAAVKNIAEQTISTVKTLLAQRTHSTAAK